MIKKPATATVTGFFLSSILFKFNRNYAVGIVGQQNFSIISSAHGLFWIEVIVNYYEIRNGSKCLSRWLEMI
jgi:hypothetical protein